MKNKLTYIKLLLVVFSVYLAEAAVCAQTLPSLLMNQDAAVLAKGSAGVVSEAGAYSLQNNVAAMALTEDRMAAQAGFAIWQPSYANLKTIGFGAMYRVIEKLAFGVDFQYLMMPSYDAVSGNGITIRDGKFTPKEYNVALGSSYAILDCLSAGATLRLAGSALSPEAEATVFGVDLGVMFKMNGIKAGVSVNNLGTKVKYGETAYPQPAMLKVGAGYTLEFGKSSIGIDAEADILFAKGLMVGAGCEYSFDRLVFVRAGYHYGDSANVIPSHASVGLGVKVFGVTLDAAYLIAGGDSPMKNTMCFGLGYRF